MTEPMREKPIRGNELATVELFEAAKAAAVQIHDLGKAHGHKASENPHTETGEIG